MLCALLLQQNNVILQRFRVNLQIKQKPNQKRYVRKKCLTVLQKQYKITSWSRYANNFMFDFVLLYVCT